MTLSPAEVEASYAACRRLCRRGRSRTFPPAFSSCPRPAPRHGRPVRVHASHRRSGRRPGDRGAPRRLGRVARGHGSRPARRFRPAKAKWAGDVNLDAAVLPAIADTVARFGIPPGHLRAVLDGVEMDLAPPCYETFAELVVYCEHVASAVGLACIHVWGFRGPARFPRPRRGHRHAIDQHSSRLEGRRPVGPHLSPPRRPSPLRLFSRAIQRGQTGEAFHRLMELEIGRAREHYAQGAMLLDWLPPPGRRVFGMMTATYRALLEEIARRPEDVFRRRIRVSQDEEVADCRAWALLPPRTFAWPPLPTREV